MQKRHILFGILVVVLGIVPFFPMQYEHIVRVGTDSYKTHYQVFGSRTKIFTETVSEDLRGFGLLVANMQRVENVPLLHLVVQSDSLASPIVQDVSLHNVRDDAFTWIVFPKDIAHAGDEISVEVSAPTADSSTGIGIRFDKDTNLVAFGTIQRVPLWKYVALWSHNMPRTSSVVWMIVFGALGACALFGTIEYIPRKFKGKYFAVALLMLALGALYIRIPLAASIDSGYGGDMFNYLSKSRAFIDGRDPFAADPRKAPLYPFLISPGLAAPFDAVWWERGVSIASAIGIVILVPLILREFKVSYSIALAGGALIAVNRDLQFESVQGLSNTLYAFLVLLAAYMFLRGRSYAVAVAAGLATLARYEGGAVAAVLVPASWIIQRLPVARIARTIIPIAVLFLIPFVIAPFSHQIGVRTISDIQGDSGLGLAYSVEDFMNNMNGFKRLFGRLWVLTPDIGDPFQAFGVGIFIGVLSVLVRTYESRIIRYGMNVIPYAVVTYICLVVIRGPMEHAVLLLSLLAGAGVSVLVAEKARYSIPIIFAVAVQIIVITIILPKDRYYLQVIPFIVIALVAALSYMSRARVLRAGALGVVLCVGGIAGFAYADTRIALPGQVSDYNEKSVGQTLLLNAARYVKSQEGIIAISGENNTQMRIYLPQSRLVMLPDTMRDVDSQLQLLMQSHVKYLVETTENPYFAKLIQAHPERFEKILELKTKWSHSTATIYGIL